MRQSLAKGTRRDLRRAIGPDVLKAVQGFDQSIGLLQHGLVTAQREIATLAVNHADASKLVTFLTERHVKDFGQVSRDLFALSLKLANELLPRQNTLWGRLRWLFTGA